MWLAGSGFVPAHLIGFSALSVPHLDLLLVAGLRVSQIGFIRTRAPAARMGGESSIFPVYRTSPAT